jgi:3-dehydroquinate synthase
MKTISVKLPQRDSSYSIYMGEGLLAELVQLVPSILATHRVFLISDETVFALYGEDVIKVLKKKGVNAEVLIFPAGEKNKNETTARRLCHALLERHCGRDSLILALGGGVVGDLAGYVAAVTLRGLPYVHLPTTVVAMVDSSIGGKVGVNTPHGKNLVGSFYHPIAVLADTSVLKSLPPKALLNGTFEALKMFLCMDRKAFEHLEKKNTPLCADDSDLKTLILRGAELKVAVVMRDEKENNERKILNFGHTVGHALEKISRYRLAHGFAVGLGMLLETQIAVEVGVLEPQEAQRIFTVLKRMGTRKKTLKGYPIEAILNWMQGDKKNEKGTIQMVLLKKIGEVWQQEGRYSHAVSESVIRKAYTHLLTP